MNITGYHESNGFVNNSNEVSVLSPVFYVDDCINQDIKLEFAWGLISKSNSSGELSVDIWFGGDQTGQWTGIFGATGTVSSASDDTDPNILNGECGSFGQNGTLSDPDALDIGCFTASSSTFDGGSFRIRFTYKNENNTGGEGVIIDDVKITSEIQNGSCQPDYEALRSLYVTTGGDDWINNSGWTTEPFGGYDCNVCDVCNWEGITCDERGRRVTRIELPENNLVGVLPDNFDLLTELEVFSVFGNNIGGRIPSSLFDIEPLFELNLNDNNFSGQFPSNITNAKNLDAFLAANNDISDELPWNIHEMESLRLLALRGNRLFSISSALPADIGLLPNLEELDLRDNSGIFGCIPFSVRTLCDNDVFVRLSGTSAEASYNAFCENESGLCTDCNDTDGITSVLGINFTVHADISINSGRANDFEPSGVINPGQLSFFAGECITLQPGFIVEKEAQFIAEIQKCALVKP